jgi:hypothetical protein
MEGQNISEENVTFTLIVKAVMAQILYVKKSGK